MRRFELKILIGNGEEGASDKVDGLM